MANVRRLARSIAVDVSNDGGTTWLNVAERIDNAPQITPNKVDATNVDTDGFTASEITLQSGVLTVKYNSLINAGTPNPAHELIEGTVAEFGDASRLTVRWYDTDGGTRGGQALAVVEVSYSKTGVPDLREVTATFTLDGTITKLTPAQIAAAIADTTVPAVTSVTPAAVGAGGLVTIKGQHFTGATAVTIHAVAMTHFEVISDSVISAVLPADGAGTFPVVVTTPAGSNAGFNYTRAA